MKQFSIFLVCFIFLFSCSKKDEEKIESKPFTPQFTVNIIDIPASSMKNSLANTKPEQKARVFLPPNYYKDSTSYPVVYFIHGYGGSYMNDYGIFKASYDEMLAGKIKEFIIVTVNCNSPIGGAFGVNSIVMGSWEEHLTREVVNYIDEHYRTLVQKESRGISGFSMGGFAALYLGFRHPDIYNLVYAYSPGVLNRSDFKEAYSLWESEGGTFLNAYGAAFSPNINGINFYAELPTFNGTENDNRIINNWINGFGNFEQKINDYLLKDARLKCIGVDYGLADHYQWIPKGCDSLVAILKLKEILFEVQSKYRPHDLSESQIKNAILPFFSNKLEFK